MNINLNHIMRTLENNQLTQQQRERLESLLLDTMASNLTKTITK